MPTYEIETPHGILEIDHEGDLESLTPAVRNWTHQRALSSAGDATAQSKTAGSLEPVIEASPADAGRLSSAYQQARQSFTQGIGKAVQGLGTVGQRIDEARAGGALADSEKELASLDSTIAKADAAGIPEVVNDLRARRDSLRGMITSLGQGKAVQEVGQGVVETGATDFQPNPKFKDEFLASTVPQVAGGAVSSIGQLLTGAGPVTLFAQVYQDTLDRNINEGVDLETAHGRALQNGIVSGGLEAVGAGIVANVAKKLTVSTAARLTPQLLKNISQGVVGEFLTGSAQEAAAEIIDEKPLNPVEILKQGGLEAMGGGMIVGPIAIGSLASRKRTDPAPLTAQVAAAPAQVAPIDIIAPETARAVTETAAPPANAPSPATATTEAPPAAPAPTGQAQGEVPAVPEPANALDGSRVKLAPPGKVQADSLGGKPELGTDLIEGESIQPKGLNPFDVGAATGKDIAALSLQYVKHGEIGSSKLLGDLTTSKTFREQGFGGFDIPTQRVVLAGVFRAAKNPEIFKAIVESIPVDVMNMLRARKLTPEMVFHDEAMLSDLLVVDRENAIPGVIDGSGSFLRKIAEATAKVVDPFSGRRDAALEVGSAIGANEISGGHETSKIPKQPSESTTKTAQGIAYNPHDFIPVIKIGGVEIRGNKGETHGEIRDRYIAEHPEQAADALVNFDRPENPNYFLKGEEPVSREQLKESLGVSDSQGLRDLQAKTPEAAPADAPTATVPAHLKPSKSVQDILDSQPATPETGMAKGEAPPEGGAIFGAGGRRPAAPAAIGATPRGDKHWLRIPSFVQRAGRGLFTEGTRAVLARQKNQVAVALAKATRQHVDIEQELFGQHETMLRKAVKAISKQRVDAAFVEAEQYIRDVENKRPAAPLAPDTQSIVDAWYDIGQSTGDIMRANNVQVFDPKLGKHRTIGHVKNYIPRMFRPEVEKALMDPDAKGNAVLFNDLAQAIATHKGIAIEAAAAELNGVAARFSATDFVGNMELARSEQLPEIFYDYDLRNLAARYLPGFSERMAQIISYGQRLGPRDAPLRKNLWDIARDEARKGDGTQEWLNVAEDQATGFKPKSEIERNARRLQAVGNATLLSDPTTTVVRNLLSGLSVTSERFGVARSMKELAAAGRAASQMDASQIGAIREDIGAFLGAEQLGDSAFDTAIRTGQRTALKWSGFSGSESFVRTHNALVASTFARDAAQSLAANPKSRLSREALAHFKRWDVDPELIIAERGEWRTGPETRKFIRTAVRESQGGYRFDQVPLWAGTTPGRFVYQYGRWGIQRAGDIFRNSWTQFRGEDIEFRGQKMTRRNVLPMMRLGLLTVGLGEAFAAIASQLFDRDRKDSSLSEVSEVFTEDESKAVGLLGERIVNDIIMAGTLGLIGQPVDFVKSMKDQTRFKNPMDPPSLAGVRAVTDLAVKAKDQGGTLTKRDLLDAAASITRGPKNVTDIGRNAADEKSYEAQNDVRTLRNAARRWAKSQGMDVSSRLRTGDVRKSANAPVFESINDALLTGDAVRARKIADEFVESAPDKKKARAALKSSAEGRSPFRAGSFSSDKYEKEFMEWARKNLSKADMNQIERVTNRYRSAKSGAGL